MKKSCLLFLTVWTLVIIITGRTVTWYLQENGLSSQPTWTPSVIVIRNNSHHTTNNKSIPTVLQSPLLKYCNLPTQKDNYFGLEGKFGDEYDLLGVITIFRHGDRGPLTLTNDKKEINCSTFVTDHYKDLESIVKKFKTESLQLKLLPKSDFCKPGLLSKQGASQLIELGNGLKESYDKHFNFSDPNATERIIANTTPYSRTIQSLYSMLYGLVGPKSFLKVSLQSKADVPFCFKHCRCEAANRFEKQHKKELNNRLKEAGHRLGNFSSQAKAILQGIGKTDKDILLPSTLKDIMLNYVCHNLTPPYCHSNVNCLKSDFMGPLDQFLQYEADASAQGLNLKKASVLRAYGLINNIDLQIQSWISLYKKRHSFNLNGLKPPRFLFYSGHDLTLMYLLSSLSIYNGHLPNYASRFTIEVLSNSGQYYARLLWNGVDVSSQACTSASHMYCNARFLPKHFRTEMQRHFQTDKFWEACEV